MLLLEKLGISNYRLGHVFFLIDFFPWRERSDRIYTVCPTKIKYFRISSVAFKTKLLVHSLLKSAVILALISFGLSPKFSVVLVLNITSE